MLRVVIDANIFVSALIRPQGPPGHILTRFVNDHAFQLVLSPPIVEELRRCLQYPKIRRYLAFTPEDIDRWVTALTLLADPVMSTKRLRVVPEDPDDDQYLMAAIEGRAQFIVTGDAHSLNIRQYEGVRIVTARAFLQYLAD